MLSSKNIRNIIFFLIVLGVCFFSSCVSEESLDDYRVENLSGKEVNVSVLTRSHGDENTINEDEEKEDQVLSLFVNKFPKITKENYYIWSETTTNCDIIFREFFTKEDVEFIANVPQSSLEKSSERELIYTNFSNKAFATIRYLKPPFIMYSKYEDLHLKKQNDTFKLAVNGTLLDPENTIFLERVIARLDVELVMKDRNNTMGIVIDTLQLINVPDKFKVNEIFKNPTFIDNKQLSEEEETMLVRVQGRDNMPTTALGTNTLKQSFYLPEHSPSDVTHRTCLKVTMKRANQKKSFIVPIGDKDNNWNIIRNKRYKLKISIEGWTPVVTYRLEVLDWELVRTINKLENEKIVFEAHFYNSTSLDILNVSKSKPLRIKVKMLEGAKNLKWKASITNGLEFGFTDVTQTYGGLNEEKIIEIVPLKPYNEQFVRNTYFYVYVTNSKNEEKFIIPLNNDGKTKVLIQQVQE